MLAIQHSHNLYSAYTVVHVMNKGDIKKLMH